MRVILHTANVVSDTKNCFYPNRVEVTSAEELHEAAKFDHVCAEYRKDYRSKNNFVKSNVLVMDCDNDHSEDGRRLDIRKKKTLCLFHILNAMQKK